jgi:beta-N-acetylglucosaminidase
MKPRRFILAFILTQAIVFLLISLNSTKNEYRHVQEINALKSQIESQYEVNAILFGQAAEDLKEIAKLSQQITDLSERVESNRKELDKVSRGNVERDVFAMDLREPCNLTAEQIDKGIGQLSGLGIHFKAAEEIYGVNAVLLAAIGMHESGGGTSKIARKKNNLFGLGSYSENPYAASMTFDSASEGIYTAARLLSEKYLSADGKYFKGYKLKDINHYYAEDKSWYKHVGAWMQRIMEAGDESTTD